MGDKTPSDKDIVVEAREFIGRIGNCGLYPDKAQRIISALADEVERLRPVVNAAVEWRRIGYERKDEFSCRIGPLLDAIDVYDVGQRRPCEEL